MPPPTAASIDPVIDVVGPEGVVPDRIVIELATAAVPEERVGKEASARTVISLLPKVSGTLKFSTPSTLVFEPREPFAPSTKYQVRLEQIETTSGVLRSPSTKSERWSKEFRTPDFRLLRMDLAKFAELASIDDKSGKLEVDLIFTAPVEPAALETLGRFSIDGAEVAAPVYSRHGERANVVRATLSTSRLKGGTPVKYTLKAGLSPKGSPKVKAPAATVTVTPITASPVEVVSFRLREGATGHFADVVCNDMAVLDKRDYYDRESGDYRNISERCLPDEASARRAIHFMPPVNFSIVPREYGFRILGAFKRGAYAVRFDAGLRTADGGALQSAYETSFSVPARSSKLNFVSQGRYLPRSAWKKLPIRHLNVSQATLKVRHVPPENLVFWMSDDRSEAASDRTSTPLLEKTLTLTGRSDQVTTTWLDLASLLPSQPRGLLELTIEAPPAKDVARIVVTDIHLVVKSSQLADAGQGSVPVYQAWALGADSLQPLPGVELRLVRKSGATLAQCATDGQGACRLQPSDLADSEADPYAVVASRLGDVTYLKFADLKAEVHDASVGGEPFQSTAAYHAGIYSDRGAYRPGDTVHLAAILRDKAYQAPSAGMPVQVRIVDPRGQLSSKAMLKTNEAGMVALDVPMGAFAPTGKYRAHVEAGSHSIGEYEFQVEEFVPERMKVTMSAEKRDLAQIDEASFRVEGRYLFGAPASDHKVDFLCYLKPATFQPPQHGDLTYGPWREDSGAQKTLLLGQRDETLDGEGRGQFACTTDEERKPPTVPMKLVARASVFESGSGRTTTTEAESMLHPGPYYLGLGSRSKRLQGGREFVATGLVVDWKGNIVKSVKEVDVELLHFEEEYSWYYSEERGDQATERALHPVVEGRTKVAVSDGAFTIRLTPGGDAPAFLLRVRAGPATSELHFDGLGASYAWAPAESVDRTPGPSRPTWLAMDAPSRVGKGTPITVRVTAPWRGRALFTVETDRVVQSEWRAVEPGEAQYTFSLAEFTPNVYISAFMIKDPHLESPQAYVPDRALGVRSITIEPQEFRQAVKLEVPQEVRSQSQLVVRLDLRDGERPYTGEPAFATVAVVDEGILSLTRFESPDPLRLLFAKRALGVDTYETMGWALLVPAAQGAAGGDGPSDREVPAADGGRVSPVKPVALWSGVVPVPKDGHLEIPFLLPLYRGKVRVMAVVSTHKRIGSAAAEVTVRDPVVVQTTLPRFLSYGDQFEIPVALTNLTSAPQKVTVAVQVAPIPVPGLVSDPAAPPAVEILGSREQVLPLGKGSQAVALFKARAAVQVGAAKLKVMVQAPGLQLKDEATVPILPAGPKERTVQRIALSPNTTLDLKGYLRGWTPTSERSTLWVTTNPYGSAFDHLKYLLTYPYG